MALNAQTGEIIWKTYMVPEGPAIGDPDFPGFSGNAVWGSTPVVDTKRGTLYIATGNNYTAPQSVLDCVEDNDGDPDAIRDCFAINYPDNYFDAIVALDIGSGEVKWGTPVIAFDSWNVACFPFPGLPSNPENCPEPTGPDHDFGQGPALYTVKGPNMPRDLIGAGQKSGQYWTLDPDSGEVVWVSLIGPGGELGGLQWGSATDGEMVYSAVANSNAEEWILQAGPNVGQAVYGGLWSAADAATGEIIWQTADPGIGGAQAAVTLANGVLYGCSMFPGQFGDNMHALDSSTGEILWSFASVGSCNAGAAVVNGTVYWGSGYGAFGVPGDNKFYAFSVPDIE